MVEDRAGELDQLYAVDLGEFTAARNALVRRLRKEGDAEFADNVAALQKPSLPVWVANQLARKNRRDVDLLLDASHRMRAATTEKDADKARQAMGNAGRAEQQAIRALREAAAEVLEGRGSPSSAMVDRVVSTMRNASRSDAGRELLASGRLTEEVEAAGFDLVEELAPSSPGRKTRREKPPSRSDLETARAALADAKERKRQSERAVREAANTKEDAMRALEQAVAAFEEAEADADVADAAVKSAEAAVDRLRRRG